MQRQQAPFRADIVGSFLRPDSIKQARQQLAEGIIDAAQLREIENNAIRHLVQQQCDCGLHVVTDGEFRRAWWHFDFFDGLQGVERYDAEQGIQFQRRADQSARRSRHRQAGVWRPPDAGGFPLSEKHQRATRSRR
ncbi:methionine synthase II [Klebsiella pneumoniae]|uniref:Methionine synthase II n=1 Tax=Klebsiella pneumoniae TaxID=573 RepID=A0A377V316_KLEPN|nr:methionine synthase II [Klebsiella pneumoniae]